MAKHSPSIVLACDGSEQSLHAAKAAAELSQATGHPLKLLTVYPGSKAEKLIIRGIWPSDLEQEQKDFASRVFDAANKALRGKVDAEEQILLKGDPAHEIVDYMDQHPGTHVVLGRRGHSMLRSLTLGSVSEKVVRHAHGPVTVISK